MYQPQMVPRCVRTPRFKISSSKVTNGGFCSPPRFVDVTEHLQSRPSFPGTPIPSDLILVHEFGGHYSLQAAKEMSLEGMLVYRGAHTRSKINRNSKITTFL